MAELTRKFSELGDYTSTGELQVRGGMSGEGVAALFYDDPTGVGDPNGLLPGRMGQLAIVNGTQSVWQNTDNGTTWVPYGSSDPVIEEIQLDSIVPGSVDMSVYGTHDWWRFDVPSDSTGLAYQFGSKQNWDSKLHGGYARDTFQWLTPSGLARSTLPAFGWNITCTAEDNMRGQARAAVPMDLRGFNTAGAVNIINLHGFSFRVPCFGTAAPRWCWLQGSQYNTEIQCVATIRKDGVVYSKSKMSIPGAPLTGKGFRFDIPYYGPVGSWMTVSCQVTTGMAVGTQTIYPNVGGIY